MHLVEITKPNPLGMAVGSYVSEDVNAGEMLSRGWCRIDSTSTLNQCRPFGTSREWNEKRVLFVRPGGFGDLLFMTPTFAEIKKRWPSCEIWVACFKRYHEALLHNPDVAGFIDYPVALQPRQYDKSDVRRKPPWEEPRGEVAPCWEDFDAQVWLENVIEENPEARETHAVDLIARRTGIELSDKQMRYVVSELEAERARMEFPRTSEGQARVGIQVSAGASCRTWPFMGDLSKRLWQGGHEVFLFGKPGDMQTNEPPGIVNLTQRGKNFRESCAILQSCDVVVAPDSALAHVAGALDVPCVALYGPFPWKVRTAYADKTFALQGVCPVSPCFHHVRPGTNVFPDYGPCASTGRCEALATITVDRVIREVEKMLTGK